MGPRRPEEPCRERLTHNPSNWSASRVPGRFQDRVLRPSSGLLGFTNHSPNY